VNPGFASRHDNRAAKAQTTVSEVIRTALRRYIDAA
jgi:hypothetical protein